MAALQAAKLKVQKYSGVRSDPNPIGPPQQAAGPSGPNGAPKGPHGPAGQTLLQHALVALHEISTTDWQLFCDGTVL